MKHQLTPPSRRRFLGSMAFGAAFLGAPRLFAEELTRTPDQFEGPFYPDRLPLDTDNDLLVVNTDITPAVGSITHLTGRVRDSRGRPMRNVLVEIWQCDNNGIYLHTEHEGAPLTLRGPRVSSMDTPSSRWNATDLSMSRTTMLISAGGALARGL